MESWLKSIKAVTLILIIVILILLLIANHLGAPSESLSYSKADLGTLGDFLGGILNPLLTFITIVLLIWSLTAQLSELKISREQQKLSNEQSKVVLEQINSSQQYEEGIMKSKMLELLLPRASGELKFHLKELTELAKSQSKDFTLFFDSTELGKHTDANIYKRKIKIVSVSRRDIIFSAKYLFNSEEPYTYSIFSDSVVKGIITEIQTPIHRAFYCIDELQKLDAPPTFYEKELRSLRFYLNQLKILTSLTANKNMIIRTESHYLYICRTAHKRDNSFLFA